MMKRLFLRSFFILYAERQDVALLQLPNIVPFYLHNLNLSLSIREYASSSTV